MTPRDLASVSHGRFPWRPALGIWLLILAAETMHGILRRLLLEPALGDLRARQVSVFTGSGLILLVVWLTIRRPGAHPARRWWQIGALWLVLTLGFEIGLGLALGASGERIASDFDPRRGGLLALGMLVILVAPRLVARARGLVRPSHSSSRGASAMPR